MWSRRDLYRGYHNIAGRSLAPLYVLSMAHIASWQSFLLSFTLMQESLASLVLLIRFTLYSIPPGHILDLAAFTHKLFRGEQTAQALESKMTKLEQKLDELLASFESGNKPGVEGSGNERNETNRQAEPDKGS